MDHTSHLFENWLPIINILLIPLRISLAVYNGLPKSVSFCDIYGLSTTLLKPKSDNFAIPCLSNILAGLISLCIILCSYSVLYPSIICFINNNA